MTKTNIPVRRVGLRGVAAARRQAVATAPEHLVRTRPLFPDRAMPLLCEPVVAGLDLSLWAEGQRAGMDMLLDRHGAILFRGFAVEDVAAFDQAVSVLSNGALEYRFRASPRTQVDAARNVYTSTDYPADESIFPHNEHSYSPEFPGKLFFWCAEPSPEGGATPIGDTREVLNRVPPAIRERFAEHGILYVRNFGDGYGLPWQTVFQTTDRASVESFCRQQGIQVEWKSGSRLRTRQAGPAIVRHPRTGDPVWFNHGTFFHASSLPASARDALLAEFAPEDLPQNTFYGNGEPIEDEVILTLRAIYEGAMARFSWQRGDILMLDNIFALHGREPFRGPRRILTAMAEPVRSTDVAMTAVAR